MFPENQDSSGQGKKNIFFNDIIPTKLIKMFNLFFSSFGAMVDSEVLISLT
jgi:hypothetical protein